MGLERMLAYASAVECSSEHPIAAAVLAFAAAHLDTGGTSGSAAASDASSPLRPAREYGSPTKASVHRNLDWVLGSHGVESVHGA
jgi:cation transport ATPase